MAAINGAMVGSYWPWSWSSRAGFLCVGLWREEGQYPNSGRCKLCRSGALDLRVDRCGVHHLQLEYRALATLLVTLGAIIAAKDLLFRV